MFSFNEILESLSLFSESVYDLVSWTSMSQINKIEGDKELDPIQVRAIYYILS